jgi:hypothetical protein
MAGSGSRFSFVFRGGSCYLLGATSGRTPAVTLDWRLGQASESMLVKTYNTRLD